MSGLGASEEANPLLLQLLVDYLGGLLGGEQERATVSRIVRVVVAGGLLQTNAHLSQPTAYSSMRQQAATLGPLRWGGREGDMRWGVVWGRPGGRLLPWGWEEGVGVWRLIEEAGKRSMWCMLIPGSSLWFLGGCCAYCLLVVAALIAPGLMALMTWLAGWLTPPPPPPWEAGLLTWPPAPPPPPLPRSQGR